MKKTKTKLQKNKQGFALLILIFAVVIIAILMVVRWKSALVPAPDEQSAIQQAQEVQEQSNSSVEALQQELELN